MTPKEKAKELFDKYNCEDLKTFAGHNLKEISKQCALKEVDKILKVIDKYTDYQNAYVYFLEVKREIEKL